MTGSERRRAHEIWHSYRIPQLRIIREKEIVAVHDQGIKPVELFRYLGLQFSYRGLDLGEVFFEGMRKL